VTSETVVALGVALICIVAVLAWRQVRAAVTAERQLAAMTTLAIHERERADDALRVQEQLQDQLRQSQKLETVGQLAGGIAHDFNNLLTVIRGHSELLSSAIDDADPRHEGIRQIHDASRRAAALTRQLLAFTRKQVLEPRVIPINQCVAGLAPMLERLIGEDITIHLSLQDSAANVMVDPGQMDQVLVNLAINARDAMPRGGILTLSTMNIELDELYTAHHEATVPGSYVLMSVSDTGRGMDANTVTRIFEPFFTTKPPGQGCGLGLSTVYGIVKQSGGYIWVYSEPHQGTTFKIYLPRASSDIHPGDSQIPAVGVRGGTETVLLVEDDHAIRSLGRQILARHGYTVLDASNGRDALHLATHHEGRLDLVITDMVMPGIGGVMLVERLIALRPNLQALYMSGYTEDDIVRRGMLDAQTAFIQKPFTATGLLQAVRHVLDSEQPAAPHST